MCTFESLEYSSIQQHQDELEERGFDVNEPDEIIECLDELSHHMGHDSDDSGFYHADVWEEFLNDPEYVAY